MKKPTRLLACFILLSTTIYAQALSPQQKKLSKTIDRTLKFSAQQALKMYEAVKDKENAFPTSSKNGKLVTSGSRGWTSGFFPGELWYLYEYTNDSTIRHAAETMTARLAREQFNTNSHDVGFIMNCSFGNGYRLTGREEYRTALINASRSLSTRFNPITGCTRSWNRDRWQFPVIIDNMMNLELLTVGSSLSGDNTCYHMAKSHADKTMTNHYRPDGSSFHIVSYDTLSGNVEKRETYQGISDESAWSRGQAWGLYGFTMMYRQTGKKEYLDHAIKIGRFIMNHPNLPKDKVPYWDFNAPAGPKTLRDASAAAVMASAYVELCTYAEGKLSEQFRTIGEQIIASLASPAYLAKAGEQSDFLIKHCTGFFAKKNELDAPLSYADYYFVEAMIRYKKLLAGEPVVEILTAFSENPDRAVWLSALDRIARPLLVNMSRGTLKINMPVESMAADMTKRKEVTHLEALGRLITGISPWLELGPDNTPEGRLRARYIDLAVRAIAQGVDPSSPDYLNFNNGRQPLVDAAFLVHGLLRAKTQLWDRLDETTRQRLIAELKSSRIIKPSETNWLFFSAMVETGLKEFAGEWEYSRVKYAFDRFKTWYQGDGWYGDGPEMHLDYYNSFVIHPMLYDITRVLHEKDLPGGEIYEKEAVRFSRYAAQLEKMISPEGSFPVIGRSMAYRFGAFHALAQAALTKRLPENLLPGQVRSALTAVIRRQMAPPETFDGNGWLTIGFCGHQPGVAESYISTGSLYLCSTVFLPLGLPAAHPFWSSEACPWSSCQAWGGASIQADKAISD